MEGKCHTTSRRLPTKLSSPKTSKDTYLGFNSKHVFLANQMAAMATSCRSQKQKYHQPPPTLAFCNQFQFSILIVSTHIIISSFCWNTHHGARLLSKSHCRRGEHPSIPCANCSGIPHVVVPTGCRPVLGDAYHHRSKHGQNSYTRSTTSQ